MPGVSERTTGIPGRFLVIIVLVAVVVSMLPVLFGALATPAGSRFVPFTFSASADFDSAVYLSWLHEGGRGYFPFRDLFLPGPPRPAVVSLGWFWIGVMSRIPFLDDQVTIQLAKVVGAVLAVLGLAAVAHYFRGPRGSPWARLTFLLTAGGLGAYAVLLLLLRHVPIVTDALPFDIATELTPFRSLLGSPHHLLALAFFPVAFALFAVSLERGRAWFALVGGALAAVVITTVPYTAPVLIVVPIAVAALTTALLRTSLSKAVRATASFLLAAVPGLLIQIVAAIHNPIAVDRYVQNLHVLPPLSVTILSFGFLAPLAAFGATLRMSDRRPRTLVLLTWLVVHTALLFLPVPFARRMVQCLIVPYAIFAFDAVAWMWSRFVRGNYGRAAAAMLGLALAVGTESPFNVSLVAQYPQQEMIRYHGYIPRALDHAFTWIRANTAEDAPFFGNPETLNLLVAYAERPVFAAHPVETPNYRERDAAYKALLNSMDGPADGRFLQNQGMRYAIADDHRDTLATGLFTRLPHAPIVFHEASITIVALQ